MGIDFYALGQRIQRKRKAKNKTQEHLAEAISVTKINSETLSNIAEYLHCDIADFLSDTVKMSDNYLFEEFTDTLKKLSPHNRKILIEIAHTLENNQ